jgi:hypothetical protein
MGADYSRLIVGINYYRSIYPGGIDFNYAR